MPENATMLMEGFTQTEQSYQEAEQEYWSLRYQIDGYIFISKNREISDQQYIIVFDPADNLFFLLF